MEEGSLWVQFPLLYRDAEDSFQYHFLPPWLVTRWASQSNDSICSNGLAGRGISLWAPYGCHGVALDPSPSINDCPGRGLLPKVTDSALMLNLPPTGKGKMCAENAETPPLNLPGGDGQAAAALSSVQQDSGCYPLPGYGVCSRWAALRATQAYPWVQLSLCGITLCLTQHVKARGKQFLFQCLLFSWEAFGGKHLPLECSSVYFVLPRKGTPIALLGKHTIFHITPCTFKGLCRNGLFWDIYEI